MGIYIYGMNAGQPLGVLILLVSFSLFVWAWARDASQKLTGSEE